MISKGRALLVEGRDDKHVVWCLLRHHDVPETFEVLDKDGVENVLKVLPVQLKASGIQAVGVLIDADGNVSSRWAQLKSILEDVGYVNVPDAPHIDGTIMHQEYMPRVGVWLMPDNSIPGMLEDFIAYLVPPEDSVFSAAKTAVAAAAKLPAPFKESHTAKAEIHTWLAWQEDPGTPLGQAITKKYLDPEAQSALKFLDWLRKVFVV